MAERRRKIRTFHFMLTAFLFLLSGITFTQDGKTFFGAIQISAGLFNLFAGIKVAKGKAISKNINLILGLMNIVVAIIIAVDYFNAGAKYIQYVWILVAMITAVALWVQTKKYQSTS